MFFFFFNFYSPTSTWYACMEVKAVGTVFDCRQHLLRVVPRTTHIRNLSYRSTTVVPLSRWSGRGILIGRPSAAGKRVAFSYSQRLLWPDRDVFELHCEHCRTFGFSWNRARPCAGTTPGPSGCSRTFSRTACRMALEWKHNNLHQS